MGVIAAGQEHDVVVAVARDGWWFMTSCNGAPGRYQIKYSDRRIVANLNFDREQRTFEFDPKANVNWWAADNVTGEPGAGTAGKQQSMTRMGIAAGKRLFALRSFDAANNRSSISNLAEIQVK